MDTLSLNGAWSVRQCDAKAGTPATVPGCVHTDLLAAGKIADPFFRAQEFDAYWVSEVDWEYSRSFDVTERVLGRERVVLRCHGLDTLATIRVNGTEIGRTDNMFRTWEFDVKDVLRAGSNTIQVRFASALNFTIEQEKARRLPGWNSGEKIGFHGHIRKEQCNFGWDWGIRTVTCGIWRAIELVAFDVARLCDVRIAQQHAASRAVSLRVSVDAELTASATRTAVGATVTVTRGSKTVAESTVALRRGSGSTEIKIAKPELWWPNAMGDQPLYDVRVALTGADGEILDRAEKRVGLRTLVLDRHKDEWGESFQFVVNGVPFFAKGANWIPADAYNNRTSPERYRDLVESAADANMNMLRVWGGGLYEEDVFYDLCDEYGICVWQDFMFGCYTYPADNDLFVANVEQEAVDNVRRLRHHASLALWCGNNELEQGLVGPEWTDRTMSWKDYSRLFDDLLPRVVSDHDGQTAYWPGSPHTPHGDRSNHRDPTCGDAHLWDVWHGMKPFEWYRTCEHRFNSEFGFQSFPEPKTTHGYTAPGDRNVTSFVMEHHQRSGIGNSTIMHYMLDWFRLPTGFDQTLWASQILQGMAIKYAVEHWRRSMPRGMGTLYWQLNDTWPVASWSSIDYHHRWKALHFMARKFFAPLLLSGIEDQERGTVEIHLTNDERAARALTLKWIVTDARGKKLDAGEKAVKSGKNANRSVHTLKLQNLVDSNGARDLIVWLEAYDGRVKVADNLVTFARPKHLELDPNPVITTTVKQLANGSFTVSLKSNAVALWSWIELAGADFRADDNFVHLRPGATVKLTVTPATKLSVAQFTKQLRVRSLADLSRG
ncbi:MAG: glycoside hydrolase family 2 protein [Spirochaetaceae bacterium]|nr:MAG: glycoside hydrolase family 2 protein [Spirochaetaceae bacterium]